MIRYGMWNVRVETSTHTCARRVLPQLICRARAPDILLVVEWTIDALALLAGLGPAHNLKPYFQIVSVLVESQYATERWQRWKHCAG